MPVGFRHRFYGGLIQITSEKTNFLVANISQTYLKSAADTDSMPVDKELVAGEPPQICSELEVATSEQHHSPCPPHGCNIESQRPHGRLLCLLLCPDGLELVLWMRKLFSHIFIMFLDRILFLKCLRLFGIFHEFTRLLFRFHYLVMLGLA